jgi:hypothetical protein
MDSNSGVCFGSELPLSFFKVNMGANLIGFIVHVTMFGEVRSSCACVAQSDSFERLLFRHKFPLSILPIQKQAKKHFPPHHNSFHRPLTALQHRGASFEGMHHLLANMQDYYFGAGTNSCFSRRWQFQFQTLGYHSRILNRARFPLDFGRFSRRLPTNKVNTI